MIAPNDWKVFEFHPGICYNEPGDSMYNQEIKERFLEESSKNIRYSTEGFRKVEEAEIKAGKDIAEMTKEESLATLKSMGIIEDSSLRSFLSTFKNYAKWCQDNHVFESTPGGFMVLKSSEIDLSDGIRNTLLQSDLDLLTTLQLVREFNEGYPEPPALCLAWLGLKAKEIIALTDDDVDMERQTITVDSQVVVTGFPNAIAQVLQQYIDCKVSERDHRTGWRQVIKDYSTGMFLKKMLPRGSKEFGKPYGYSQITAAVSKLNAKLIDDGNPGRLKFDNVWNSGRYYKLWETEQSGVDVTKPANRPIVEEILHSSKSYYNAIRMYKAYKKAFGLDEEIPAQK